MSLKDQYIQTMANKISVSLEDLTGNEMALIEAGWALFQERMEDIKLLEDENRRITIDLANAKVHLASHMEDNLTPHCPECHSYDWSYHYAIDAMKCDYCGYRE